MFTFVTISYNQERFIVEHLESIKYQIENFGANQRFEYVLSDDGSSDSTIQLAEKWIESNDELFAKVHLLRSNENRGIVQNYLRGTSQIETEAHKVLAGDDLFYRNDVFGVIGDYDLVMSPVIKHENAHVTGHMGIDHLIPRKDIRSLESLIRMGNYFNAPGLFMTTELVRDSGLKNAIARYKWIEDLPTWHYLFTQKNDLRINISKVPYVLYRTSHGISMNKRNARHSEFDAEQRRMAKDLDLKAFRYPKYVNPYRYYMKYLDLKHRYYDSKWNQEIIEANEIMRREINEAPDYINDIRKKAADFYTSIGREDLYELQLIAKDKN